MAITYKTEGIIIKFKDYKEADRLYTVYTLKFGKLILRAQAVKKINSKLAGHLEPFNKCQLFIAQSKSMPIIAGAQITSSYRNIKKNLEQFKIYHDCLIIFDDLITDQEKDPEIYQLLDEFLTWCDSQKINSLIKLSFIFKLLKHLGYQPDFKLMNNDLIKITNFLINNRWQNIQRLRLDNSDWRQLYKIYISYLSLYLHKNLQIS